MSRIGIDLGTTNTVVAVDDDVLTLDESTSHLLPSVVAFLPNGTTQFGEAARRRRAIDSQNTIYSSKRIIGLPFDHSQTRQFRERYPFDIVEADGLPAFQTRAGIQTPVDVGSLILGRVYSQIESFVDDYEVVITVPIAFKEAQREATRMAARQAGFNEVHLVDEPTATAWAYHSDPDVEGVVAVYDLGGGTFDVSVLDCGESEPRLLAGASEPFLGGDDIDRAIADWVAEEVLKQQNWDLTNYSEVQMRLLAECERAKIRLSHVHETSIELAEVDPECPIAGEGIVLRREVMERLATKLVQQTFVTCDAVLQRAGVRPGDLRAVLLAGGTSHLQIIQSSVEAYFGRAGFIMIDPTEVVARGASQTCP